MLQDQVFRRDVVLVGENSGVQDELLRGTEFCGSFDEIGSETAREEIARRARGEHEQSAKQNKRTVLSSHVRCTPFFSHSLSPFRLASPSRDSRGGCLYVSISDL